jgi:uncharacterized protein YdhG (YjbR/CyaY superfamily)
VGHYHDLTLAKVATRGHGVVSPVISNARIHAMRTTRPLAKASTFASHERYIENAPADVRPALLRIQAKVESLLPDAVRCISYNMPAFKSKRVFFYFAAFKRHIGVYPPVTKDAALRRALALYLGPKGNLSFPLDQPLPIDLVGRVAVALHIEYQDK